MSKVEYYGCYDFNQEWYLVEMLIDVKPSDLDWNNFVVPEEGIAKCYWQCAYNEQYLNEDGTSKICELYEEPEDNLKPSRVTFFIYKDSGKTLSTPYGDFELENDVLPKRLINIIEFEDD